MSKKNNIKLGVALVIGSTIVASENATAQTNENNQDNKIEENSKKTFPIIKKDSIELEKRLKELAETEFKGELATGAMCYIASPNSSIKTEYNCPVCNTKTKHNRYPINDIKYIRKVVKKIKAAGYDVLLDESDFCEHCSKIQNDMPELIFKIRFSNSSNYHLVKSNFISEYECLLQFLSGKEKYMDLQDFESSIHDTYDIIQKMTGLGKDLPLSKKAIYLQEYLNKQNKNNE